MKIVKYELINKFIPETKGTEIVKDLDFGGIKLVYSVKAFKTETKKLFGLIPYTTKKGIKKHQVVFLKPYKKYLTDDIKKVPKHQRGSPNSPFSGVWLSLSRDYESWSESFPLIRPRGPIDCVLVKQHELIGNLNRFKKKFSVITETSEDKKDTELSKSIRKIWIFFYIYIDSALNPVIKLIKSLI